MFTLGVFSDSHGRSRRLYEGMERAVQGYGAQGFLFLGDGLGDFLQQKKAFPGLLCWQVQGNGDFLYPNSAVETMFTLENHGIYAVHGHRWGVKQGEERLLAAALERKCQIACFGHTHSPIMKEERGVLLFNPGAIGSLSQATFGILTLSSDNVSPCIVSM